MKRGLLLGVVLALVGASPSEAEIMPRATFAQLFGPATDDLGDRVKRTTPGPVHISNVNNFCAPLRPSGGYRCRVTVWPSTTPPDAIPQPKHKHWRCRTHIRVSNRAYRLEGDGCPRSWFD